MRYKVGEKVVLKNGKTLYVIKVEIAWEEIHDKNATIHYVGFDAKDHTTFGFKENDIDHEETAELNSELNKKSISKQLPTKLEELLTNDNPIQPSHYQSNGKDLIEMWKDLFDEKDFRAVMKSHILKYIVRYERKNGVEDLRKADEYKKRLIEWEESLDD